MTLPTLCEIRGVTDLEAVYYLSPDRQKLVRVIAYLLHPNGLIGTPDGKVLHVASDGGSAAYAYDIRRTER